MKHMALGGGTSKSNGIWTENHEGLDSEEASNHGCGGEDGGNDDFGRLGVRVEVVALPVCCPRL